LCVSAGVYSVENGIAVTERRLDVAVVDVSPQLAKRKSEVFVPAEDAASVGLHGLPCLTVVAVAEQAER
jgi:hypothetical protein